MRFLIVLGLWFMLFVSPVTAVSERTNDKNGDGEIDTWIEEEEENVICLRADSNFDGRIDYLLRTDAEGTKLYEEIDFNHDGDMDDFYFYSDGLLDRRELDSNYDGAVDIWVFLDEGAYIRKYMKDSDYNGLADIEKDYSQEAED